MKLVKICSHLQNSRFILEMSSEVGALTYARFLVEERNHTVGLILFYNINNNERCIAKMKHKLQLMLPYDTHYVQFKENFDKCKKPFSNYPDTQKSGNVVRLWESIEMKRNRTGVRYNAAETAKNEVRRLLLDELCRLDRGFEMHISDMIQKKIEMVKKWNERRREFDEDEWFKDE
ncbi:unnamed protein product [Brachionus calyciflorus]|uniref:Uncharacterized protein n=1 Tax=Brachionus calyciflorus TaxID=104777 RepID=A0A814E7A8_9BILA|nr:unnamed protein product [Brachionus calyciflorus]